MKDSQTVNEIRAVLESAEGRAAKVRRIADLIRDLGSYRWVGIYDVGGEISIISWSGPGAPAYPRFPVDGGLSGEAVRSRATVIVNDVASDPRYLTAFGSTKSEMIVPVHDPLDGHVVGTIDVESEHTNAFGVEDQTHLEQCAVVLAPLFTGRTLR